MKNLAWGRLVLTLFLAVWGFVIASHPADQTILHVIILPIHETGHIVFAPFGEFMGFLGGSLFQILFPLIFAGYFFFKGDRHGATVPLWFAGVSAVDVVPYIKDAPYGELELIGGEHDWSYLLSELTQVHNAEQWGNAVLGFGVLCMLAALILGILWLPKTDPAPSSP